MGGESSARRARLIAMTITKGSRKKVTSQT